MKNTLGKCQCLHNRLLQLFEIVRFQDMVPQAMWLKYKSFRMKVEKYCKT